jgi:pSer/pThr/pTyr-binding forkhead associated (FHA) protein
LKDDWLSKEHATFRYDEGKLFVEDAGSVNGVFVRIQGSVKLESDQAFICGDHVFAAEITPKDSSAPDVDETYFYSSPKVTSPFRVVEQIDGGRLGMVCCAQGTKLRIGRQECNMNFPRDRHMSPRHASLSIDNDGAITLKDDKSNNGVYVRASQAHELKDGDYLMLGRQLLRVEFTAS